LFPLFWPIDEVRAQNREAENPSSLLAFLHYP